MHKKEIVIIGGGLAGLVCAIHLRKLGLEVLVIEKHQYPQHKVCGEYVSNEVLPYLKWLDCDPNTLLPTRINYLSLSARNGEIVDCKLPLGGFGISRFALDNFLYTKAKLGGCEFLTDRVTNVSFENNGFVITTSNNGDISCSLAIGAYGKRSALDQKLQRRFMLNSSPWLAIKAHYKGEFDEDLVALHTFDGGYCGVSKVEKDLINICYLTEYKNFKTFRNINDFQERVLQENPHLKRILENSTMIFEQPMTIAQISFDEKEPVHNHMLMIGDTAGLIHPLCGNGMAMAIHGAKLCAELCKQFASEAIDRKALERRYTKTWDRNFKGRLFMGRVLSAVIRNKRMFEFLMVILLKFPSVLPLIIRKTHGTPIPV